MAEGSRRSRREVKEFTVHNVVRVEVPVEALVVGAGSGTKIGQLPGLVRRLNAVKNHAPVLKCAFAVMFPGQQFTKERAKSCIQLFNGFASGLEHNARIFLESVETKLLRSLGCLFNIIGSFRKAIVVERLVEFLKSPKDLIKESKIIKRKPAAKEIPKVATAPKSGYWHFCKVNHSAVEKAHPEAKVSPSLLCIFTFPLPSASPPFLPGGEACSGGQGAQEANARGDSGEHGDHTAGSEGEAGGGGV